MADAPLKLAAEDADDLKVVSALLQDAIVKVGDISWLPKARRFACVLNRYRWEAGRPGRRGERVRTGLLVSNVSRAQTVNIRQDAKDAVLSLLAVTFEGEPGAGGYLTLALSGGGAVRLAIDAIDVRLDDLSQPWQARARPQHRAD